MAGQRETPPGSREQKPHEVTFSNSLLVRRNLPQLVEPPHPESRYTELVSNSTICSDQGNISAGGRPQILPEIHSLHLQQNQIEKIENLGCFPNLRFLCLAGNCIRRVENLQPLQHLQVLDLSHNLIQTLDPAELPRSLRVLNLKGNKCTHQQGYRELVLGALPHLLQLDTQPVPSSRAEEEEEEGGSSSSEDEDEELLSEPTSPFTAGKDFFLDLHQELVGRSRHRQREALEEHQARLEELEELQDLLLPPPTLNPGREGAACPTALPPSRSQPCPQAKLGTKLPPLAGPSRQPHCPQPQRAPSGNQPWNKALHGETWAKGGKTRLLPPIPPRSTAPHGWD